MSTWMNELADWWAALPNEWAFLMLLPFLVGAVALLVHSPMGSRSTHASDAQQAKPRGRRRRFL